MVQKSYCEAIYRSYNTHYLHNIIVPIRCNLMRKHSLKFKVYFFHVFRIKILGIKLIMNVTVLYDFLRF